MLDLKPYATQDKHTRQVKESNLVAIIVFKLAPGLPLSYNAKCPCTLQNTLCDILAKAAKSRFVSSCFE